MEEIHLKIFSPPTKDKIYILECLEGATAAYWGFHNKIEFEGCQNFRDTNG